MKTGCKFSAALLALLLIGSVSAHTAELTVEVTGITEAKGEVLITLFSKPEGWLRKGVAMLSTSARVGTVAVTFKDVPEGEHAVSAIHDANSNKKLDSNAVGMPIEPYGFSNDAAGSFGPPTFEQAKFRQGPANQSITIKLG